MTNSISLCSIESASLTGMFYKYLSTLSNTVQIVKFGSYAGGLFSNLEPVSEVLAYKIFSKLGIECVISRLDTVFVKEYRRDILVSSCPSFILDSSESLVTARKLVGYSNDKVYSVLTTKFSRFRKDIDKMIVGDFLINNIDRHMRNFGIIYKNGNPSRFTPLYDHGLSLYSDVGDKELENDTQENWELIDEAKPFKSSHYEQIKLVDKNNLSTLKKVSINELLQLVDKYKKYITPYRIKCIKYLLKTIFNYLKKNKYI